MPIEPLRLRVINRIVEVLQGIREGDDYFYSPRQVVKGFIAEPKAYPVYMVTSESGGEINMHSDSNWAETFYVAVRGIVADMGDVVTPLERAIRDVKKAIDGDMASGLPATSLGGLVTSLVFDTPAEIDYGFEGTGFLGYFVLRIKIQVDGTFSEI